MSEVFEHSLAGFAQLRLASRRMLVEFLGFSEEEFDWDEMPLLDRSTSEVMADAMATSKIIADLFRDQACDFDIPSMMPGYMENSTYRESVDVLLRRYLDSEEDQKARRGDRLMSCVVRNSSPNSIPARWRPSGEEGPFNMMKEAVALHGGVTKAAAAIGVSEATLKAWLKTGVITDLKKGEWLFRSAGIVVNPRRLAVVVRRDWGDYEDKDSDLEEMV